MNQSIKSVLKEFREKLGELSAEDLVVFFYEKLQQQRAAGREEAFVEIMCEVEETIELDKEECPEGIHEGEEIKNCEVAEWNLALDNIIETIRRKVIALKNKNQ